MFVAPVQMKVVVPALAEKFTATLALAGVVTSTLEGNVLVVPAPVAGVSLAHAVPAPTVVTVSVPSIGSWADLALGADNRGRTPAGLEG